jgi:hypothetical protein
MTRDLERFIADASLRYTKNVDPEGQTTFTIPFDSPSVGVIPVNVFTAGNLVGAYALVRTLDSIGVKTSKALLLTELLKLHYGFLFARVHVCADLDPDGQEWVVVSFFLPADGLSEHSFVRAIQETANLVEKVHEVIQAHTATQGVPGVRSP